MAVRDGGKVPQAVVAAAGCVPLPVGGLHHVSPCVKPVGGGVQPAQGCRCGSRWLGSPPQPSFGTPPGAQRGRPPPMPQGPPWQGRRAGSPHLVPPYGVEMESRNCIHKVSVAVSCMCRKVTEEGYSQNALSFICHNNRVNQLFFVYYK